MDQKQKILSHEKIFSRNIFVIISILTISTIVKFYFFEQQLPVIFDGRQYFEFSVYLMNQGLPSEYSLDNLGWPIFLSMIFGIFSSNGAEELMQIQKITTVLFSSCSGITIYFLCKRFVDRKFAIMGMAIFSFEPRIIENSLLGVTEPLFIFLLTLSLVLFLSDNSKKMYIAFGITSLATIVRSEGIFLFFALSIMFFIQTRKDKLIIPKYLIILGIFFIILSPIIFYQFDVRGDDRLFTRMSAGLEQNVSTKDNSIFNAFSNFGKFFMWNLIPIFFLFLPLGIVGFFRNFTLKKLILLITGISFSLPALYAYSIPALDTRYIFPIYPILCVISVFSLQYFNEKFKLQKNHLILIVIGILIVSFIFLNDYRIDTNYEKEVFVILKDIPNDVKVTNSFYPEEGYFKSIEIINEYPEISFPPDYNVRTISTNNFKNLNDYIQKNTNLTHIIVDNNNNRPEFLKEIFLDEKKYNYLEKIYESSKISYHLKIFKINYDEMNFDKN